MKPDVIPHIFDCQPDRKRVADFPERLLPIKRERQRLVDEALSTESHLPVLEVEQLPTVMEDIPSTSNTLSK